MRARYDARLHRTDPSGAVGRVGIGQVVAPRVGGRTPVIGCCGADIAATQVPLRLTGHHFGHWVRERLPWRDGTGGPHWGGSEPAADKARNGNPPSPPS
jgi:hypothetical protein